MGVEVLASICSIVSVYLVPKMGAVPFYGYQTQQTAQLRFA